MTRSKNVNFLFLLNLISFFLVFIFSAVTHADDSAGPLTAKAVIHMADQAAKVGQLQIQISLVDPYKAYADRFKVLIEEPLNATVENIELSPLVKFEDQFSKKMREGIKGQGLLTAKVTFGSAEIKNVKLKLTYQACTHEHCLFPKSIFLDPTFSYGNGTTNKTTSPAPADKTATSLPASDFSKSLEKGLITAMLFMFVAGFLTSLTPCIYPMIPITLAILGAAERRSHNREPHSQRSRLKGFLISLFYVLGIATTYSTLGVTAASTGALFGSALSNIWVVTALALMFVVMGLSMYGLFEIQVPAFLRDRLGQGKSRSGFLSAYGTGLAAGIVASPCVGPVLVSVLAYIAQTQNKLLGFGLLFSFALGMGVLFIGLGTFSSLIQKAPKAGPWMDTVKFIFGTTMIAMALYYVAPVYPNWLFRGLVGITLVLLASYFGLFSSTDTGLGKLKRGLSIAVICVGILLLLISTAEKSGFSMVAQTGATGSQNAAQFVQLDWQPFSDSALETALKAGRPVIIDFWADWCGACHELEEKTFTDRIVRELSKSFTLLKVNATEDSPEIDRLKTKFAILGLPTILFYDSKGSLRNDQTVTGFEEADRFIIRMNESLGRLPASTPVEQK